MTGAPVRLRAALLTACLLVAGPFSAESQVPEPEAPGTAPVDRPALPTPPPGPSADTAALPADAAAEKEPPELTISLDPDGTVALTGVVATPDAEARMLARARALAGENTVTSSIAIGDGPLPADWKRLMDQVFLALERVVSGTATIDEGAARFDGVAEEPRARDAALAALAAPEWQATIEVQLELAEPYTFTAEKSVEGLTYAGHAPDAAMAASLQTMIDDVARADTEGEIALARGMPDEDWPQLVRAGVVALTTADTGRLVIEDREVSLTAEVADSGANRRLVEQLGTGWQVDITIRDPAPEPRLVLEVAPEGLAAEGRLPGSIGIERLTDMLGPIDTPDGLTADAYGENGAWRDAIDALAIAVPRMREGRIEVGDGKAHFEGALKDGFSASDLRSALRTTLGPHWELELGIGEAPPPAQLEIVRRPDGFDIDGILPEGVRPERLFGFLDAADTSGLTTGGEGDGREWRRQLREAARALRVFETGGASIEGRTVSLSGTLQPGYTAEEISDWLRTKLDDGWEVTVEAEDRPGRQGDRRAALEGGEEELRYGRWLPVHEFEATPESCEEMLAEAEGGRRITFVAGSSDISAGQERLLDRLAGVIRRCVITAGLDLEIQGHTDDRGEAAENLLLSEARALEVVLALTERGVPASRLEPVGYGETRPIADNETEDGRARNRRISFAWQG